MSVTMEDRVAVVTLPELLSEDALAALLLEVTQVLGDPSIDGMVLAGGARIFCHGLPVDSTSGGAARDIVRHLRSAGKPVIAAIRGSARGAGLELALAARMRVAHPDARLSMPQIKQGLPPSALGTQTLPALVGAGPALEMILGGAALRAGAAPDGVIDLLDTAPEDAAIALAASGIQAPDRLGLSDPAAFFRAIETSRAEPSILEVRGRIIDCIEAALTVPGYAAEDMEAQAEADALASDASRALRHLARDEAANAARDSDARLPPRVAILGGSAAAGGIAEAALRAGSQVDLIALDDAGLAHAAGIVIDRIEALAESGALPPERIDTLLGVFRPGVDMEPMGRADLVIEAATSDAALRAELAQAIALFSRPGVAVVLGGIDSDPAALMPPERSADVLGLHFPFRADGLAELAIHDAAGRNARRAGAALARALGRRPILAGVAPGRIVARLAETSLAVAEDMIVEGADPALVDMALHDRFGIARGPLARAQADGLAAVQKRRGALGWGAGGLIDLLLRAGGDTLDDAPAVAAEMRAADDVPLRTWNERAITNRWLAVLAAEAARMLADGDARRAGDLNIASLAALGLPRLSGGLLHAADRAGLLDLTNTLRVVGLTPPELLSRMVRNGQSFAEL